MPATGGSYAPDRDYTNTGTFRSTTGIGYGNLDGSSGVGGVITQATNRTTGVTLNTICGAITTSSASLAAEAAAEFTVTNSLVANTDVVVLAQRSGSNGGNTVVYVSTVANGSFKITVSNNNAAAGTAETGAIILNFAVVKSVAV